jgi:hypothetical protein
MDKDLENMYFNYITNLINYFEIKDITGFREAIANLVINQPDPTSEELMIRWTADFTGTIFTYSTLSEDILKERFKKELIGVSSLVKEIEQES